MSLESKVLVLAVMSGFATTVQAQVRAPRPAEETPQPYIEPWTMIPPVMEPMMIEPMIADAMAIAPMAIREAQTAIAAMPPMMMAGVEAALAATPMALEQAQLALEGAAMQLGTMGEIAPPPYAYTPRPSRAPRAEQPLGTPPAPSVQGDPADSLYRAARSAMNRREFLEASNLFASIRTRFPRSTYIADSYYWDAYGRWRDGTESQLRAAQRLIEELREKHPRASIMSEANRLRTQVRSALARRGDREAAQEMDSLAATVAPTPRPNVAVQPPRAPRPPATPRPPRVVRDNADDVPAGCSQDEYEDKVAALNALMQMNSDRALPLLKGLLGRRDECSAPLRRKAVFLVAQQKSAESVDILLNAVKNDPDPEVRKQGVFWLGQVSDERAVDILGEILRTSGDEETQKRAMFALSQHRSDRAVTMVRAYAEREDVSAQLRKDAVFYIGQHASPENATFLRGLYAKSADTEVKERVLFSVSQIRGENTGRWLLEIAANTREPIEMRKKALFYAGQQPETNFSEFSGLYETMPDTEMKKQLIFVYAQRKEPQALDRLVDIAQKETDRELKKQAIFWLGNSQDPRVLKILEDILNK